MDLVQLIVILTPLLVYVGTWIALKLLPLIPGWAMLSVAGILSAILTWIISITATSELAWYWQFLLGMLSVVVSQIIKQFTPAKIVTDIANIKKLKTGK
jgi:hypothetical protein